MNNAPITYEELKSLVNVYGYGRYCEDPRLEIKSSRQHLLKLYWDLLSRGKLQCFSAHSSKGEITGILLYRFSEWDTSHFGFNVAIVDLVISMGKDRQERDMSSEKLLEKFFAWCHTKKIRFVTAKIPSLDLSSIHAFENKGFSFIETWIYYYYDLAKGDEDISPKYGLRLITPDDLPKMIEYARGAFSLHRFHADQHIPLDLAESLYSKWITTAFNDSDQYILVMDFKGKPAAFMIYFKNDLSENFGLKFCQWKMVVIDPNIRGKGIGTQFFQELIYYHRKEGLDIIDGGLSIRNLHSLNLHAKLDFKPVSTLVTLHKWFGKDDENA